MRQLRPAANRPKTEPYCSNYENETRRSTKPGDLHDGFRISALHGFRTSPVIIVAPCSKTCEGENEKRCRPENADKADKNQNACLR